VASVSSPESVLKLLRSNIDKLINGDSLEHIIDKGAGY